MGRSSILIGRSKRTDDVIQDDMPREGAVSGLLLVLGVSALVHAMLAWSPVAAIQFGAVAVGLAFVAEVAVVQVGLLRHRLYPQVLGVPLAALAGWTFSIYVCFRLATFAVDPAFAPIVTAGIATAFDLVLDPIGVRAGLWEYPRAGIPGPRFRDVPWWNFAGWLLLPAVVVSLAGPV